MLLASHATHTHTNRNTHTHIPQHLTPLVDDTMHVCAPPVANPSVPFVFAASVEGIDDGWLGLDIGPNTIKANAEVIRRSKTIFWNGP